MEEKHEKKQYFDLSIKPLPTNKVDVFKRPLMEQKIIPGIGKSILCCARSGGGKSTLVGNLLVQPHFWGIGDAGDGKKGPYFHKVVIFSSTAGKAGDDLYTNVPYLSEDNFISDFNTDYIDMLLDAQKDDIKANGFGKCKRLLLIFDDVLSHPKFLNSKQFLKLFVEIRHYCATAVINSQSFTKVPRACRLSCNQIYYWPGSQNENIVLCEHHTPCGLRKDDFLGIMNAISKQKYAFLNIDMSQPEGEGRYKMNLDQVISLDRYIN